MTAVSVAQQLCTGTTPCVTTWHDDNNRTGWQPNEPSLSPSTVSPLNAFGLLWQWTVTGPVFAQPLAVANVPNVSGCASPCNLVFISTENDMLYAFNSASSSSTAVWSVDLAGSVGGTSVDCTNLPVGVSFGACNAPSLSGGPVGVTGTPVIDLTANPHPILYVVGAIYFSNPLMPNSNIEYYLFAVDITSHAVLATTQITGMVDGLGTTDYCAATNPPPGSTIAFDPSVHIQRSALLLLPVNEVNAVYVAFAPDPEYNNGWLFGYQLSGSSFSQTARFVPTPSGTGGGIWQAGAGPASDGTYIYTLTGNGTFSYDQPGLPPAQVVNYGDSLLKLNPPNLAVVDYYTPSDVLTFGPIPPETEPGRCYNDEDFASGGVLLPTGFTYNNGSGAMSVVISADKESQLYVENKASPGKYNPNNGNNNIETLQSPANNGDFNQGYWASPAYWNYTSGSTTNYMLYYSVTTHKEPAHAPLPINGYQLLTTGTSGPIPSTYLSTPTSFCQYSPTPSVSSNGTTVGTGIVWAIEQNQNKDNQVGNGTDCLPGVNNVNIIPHAALHAYCASGATSGPCATGLAEIYTSRNVQTPISEIGGFPTPTVFNGQVYMGTKDHVNVFGICPPPPGKCLP
jgi:hypothetical protein